MATILGLNAYHGDSSACVLVDGKLVAAVEEERFTRIKHWAGFPVKSILYCLGEAGIELDEVDCVSINTNPRANLAKKILFTLKSRPSLSLIAEKLATRKKRENIETLLGTLSNGVKTHYRIDYVEHHMAHLASAFIASPFDTAAVLSVDGFGDFGSVAIGIGRGTTIEVKNRVFFPHSLGIFYQALTQYLGFYNYGDEYKVMGLAPYGEPSYMDEMDQLVKLTDDGKFELNLDYFVHHKQKVAYKWEGCAPEFERLFSEKLDGLLGKRRSGGEALSQRHKDIARSIQAMYEKCLFHMVNTFSERYSVRNMALAGGCGMNSVANGKFYTNTKVERLYVQPAAGDAGGAIGAAYVSWYKISKSNVRCQMTHAYWGPSFSDQYVKEAIHARSRELDENGVLVNLIANEAELYDRTAQSISDGLVVGWFQGRMEWGPRALGNRSIIGDPRRSDMKDILNIKIKRREAFRPFAPSILRDHVSDWFEVDDDVPFMMKVYKIKAKMRNKVPAITHVDGTGRLQTVTRDQNERYYGLISAFYGMTGIPLVLNTSFNENEPIVCKPDEALDCFLRTKMDVLVLGDHYLWREV